MPKPATEIVRAEPTAALASLNPQELMQSAIAQGAGVETLERLVALAKEVRAEHAKAAWYRAMAEFQRDCPPIVRDQKAEIRTRSGSNYSYRYASLDSILKVVQPVMGQLGLSVAFRCRPGKALVIAECLVSHELGHTESSGEIEIPIADDAMGANAAQRVGIASTYAKRYALLAALGLAPEDDTDAKDYDKPKVRMPERQSAQAGATVWSGALLKLSERSGEKQGKPWTIHTLHAEGIEFKTFDTAVVNFARSFVGTGAVLRVTYRTNDKGSHMVEDITTDEPEGEAGE